MSLAVFVLGGLALGFVCMSGLRRGRHFVPYESGAASGLQAVCATLLFAFAIWTASSWLLALTHALTYAALVLLGSIELVVGLVLIARLGLLRPSSSLRLRGSTVIAVALAMAPVVAWVGVVSWRGTVLPPYNHDALAYHMPKAVLLMEAQRFGVFSVPEARIATWPCNYELLLADTMILSGSDHYTAAIGTVAYVGVILATALLAASWWGSGVHAVAAAAAVAGVPILILHSGLHKNDLLETFFALAVFVGSARWLAAGCTVALVEATVALLLAIGTKVNGFVFLVAAAPVLMMGAVRHRALASPRRSAVFVAAAAALSMLLGGAAYVANLVVLHKPVLPPENGGEAGYGDWSNIWVYTTMVLLRPFGRDPAFAWNPFRQAYWWWRANDVWTAHFGAAFSLAVLALVPCVLCYRANGARVARAAGSLAALGAYVLFLPIHMQPLGFFAGYGRYVVFVAPFVVAWTVSPLLIELGARAGRGRAWVEAATCACCGLVFLASAYRFGVYDEYAPLSWAATVAKTPNDRVPLARRNRAASIFDQRAEANTACAIDVGFETWIYPAYGERWTRKVEFLPHVSGPVPIPEDVDWVLVDHTWNFFFGKPGLVDTSAFYPGGPGGNPPTDEDRKVYRQLLGDPRFEVVYEDEPQCQAVFRRRSGAPSP